MNPNNTIFDAKRLVGRKFNDSTVQSDRKHWPFQVIDQNGLPRLRVGYQSEEKTFTPEEISSMVLVKMKETAEAYLGSAASGDKGCRRDCRAQRSADHQRAHSRCHRLRIGQEKGSGRMQRAHLRSRWWHF